MARKLTDLVKDLAVVSGIPEAEISAALLKLGDTPLKDITLDDAVANKMATGLLSEDAAINNPKILNTAKAQVLNGVDTEISNLETEYGFSDDQKKRIKDCKTSFQKIKEAAKIAQEIVEAKHADGKKTESQLTKDIDGLNGKLADLVKKHTEDLAAKDTAMKNMKLDWTLDNIYSGKEYALGENIPKDTAILTAKNIVENAKKKYGVVIELADDGTPVVLRSEGKTKYFDEKSTDLSKPEDFITRLLTESKILKVSQGKGRNAEVPITGKGGKPLKGLEELDRLITASETSLHEQE